jgi:hypothetical protein
MYGVARAQGNVNAEGAERFGDLVTEKLNYSPLYPHSMPEVFFRRNIR